MLEKEALVKGVPIEQAIDIEIPPPRPKRKPSNPYPRKTGAGAASSSNTQVRVKDGKQISFGSSHTTNQALDLEKEPLLEKTNGDDGKQNAKEDKCSETITLFQETRCTLGASANENSAITAYFKGPVPMKTQSIPAESDDSHAAHGPNMNYKADKPDIVETAQNDTGNEMHAAKNFPRHAPVQILDGSLGGCSQALSSDVSYQESAFHHTGIPGHPALYSNPAVSAAVESQNSTARSNHQTFSSFHLPFTPIPNTQENCSSYLQMSSTFSSMIVSALLQNPAAHAAATFAASFWPSTNMEASSCCPVGTNGGLPPRPMNTAPSMAAIAAATVAAATAWWAAHGLLPLCAPPHTGFTCPPASVGAALTNVAQTQAANEEREENGFQNPGLQVEQPDKKISDKSSATSSSDSGNSSGAKTEIVMESNSNGGEKVPAMTDEKESSHCKNKKQVDRSSCGSNTPSGSDIETDALEKNDKAKEESEEPDVSHPSSDLGNRRNRVATCINDNWKEVSQGGRKAFQALFSRERLPQSFSPPQNDGNTDKEMNDGVEKNRQNAVGIKEDAPQLDLNSNTWESCSSDQGLKDGLLTIGLQAKLKTRKIGFKPYKRCSVEARESRVNPNCQDQEKSCKRLRLEGEAPI